jgi:hypothetical protein
MILSTAFGTFQCSDALKNYYCKETDRVLHRMLVCEIFRDLRSTQANETLSCRFPSRTGFICVTLLWDDESEVLTFKLEPGKSIEVPIDTLCPKKRIDSFNQ